jgi:tRNA (guanine-N7-)-methyltransferase
MLNSAEPIEAQETEILPDDYFRPLDLPAIYGRRAPLEVDLGCGDGSFLVATAESKPEHDVLGIERLAGRVNRACRNIERRRVTNARVLLVESSYAVEHLLPPAAVEVFHLLFPDPWPKRRHWRRRVVTNDFLSAIHRALVPQGTVRIATDQLDYFQEIEHLISQFARFAVIPDTEVKAAISTFEKRFRQSDLAIHRLVLRKISSPRNEVASQ